MRQGLSDLFQHTELMGDHTLPEDLFSILETFEDAISKEMPPFYPSDGSTLSPGVGQEAEEAAVIQATKKRKLPEAPVASSDSGSQDGRPQKMAMSTSHITVERNRRKQMNEHLSVLRSLMPCFYAKRGDQASIIGGVVDYIKELQQVLQSLEAKKQRKAYSQVLSPRPVTSSPRPSPLSPRPPPPSPRMAIPISPTTPQPGSPYKPKAQQNVYLSPSLAPSHELSPPFSSAATASEVAANSRSEVAEVEVKLSGSNVILKTVSHRIPGQALKIIAALEGLALEILHVSISAIDDYTMLNSFTIKIGIECELSAEELVQEIQQTFLRRLL